METVTRTLRKGKAEFTSVFLALKMGRGAQRTNHREIVSFNITVVKFCGGSTIFVGFIELRMKVREIPTARTVLPLGNIYT